MDFFLTYIVGGFCILFLAGMPIALIGCLVAMAMFPRGK